MTSVVLFSLTLPLPLAFGSLQLDCSSPPCLWFYSPVFTTSSLCPSAPPQLQKLGFSASWHLLTWQYSLSSQFPFLPYRHCPGTLMILSHIPENSFPVLGIFYPLPDCSPNRSKHNVPQRSYHSWSWNTPFSGPPVVYVFEGGDWNSPLGSTLPFS